MKTGREASGNRQQLGFRSEDAVFRRGLSVAGRGSPTLRREVKSDRMNEVSGSLPRVAVMQSSDLRDGDDLSQPVRVDHVVVPRQHGRRHLSDVMTW